VSEPSRGVIARVTFNHPPSGRGLEPRQVEHLQLGLSWRVTEILDRWEHPGRPEDMIGKPDLIKCWLLKVSGPLPGRPAERAEFVMEVSFHGVQPAGGSSRTSLPGPAGESRQESDRKPQH